MMDIGICFKLKNKMMDIIKLIFDKLSQYNFLTNILPGTVLCIILKNLVGYDLIPTDYYQAGIVFYFVGMVNSRVGSLIIEPILKKICWIKFAPYPEFLKAIAFPPLVIFYYGDFSILRDYDKNVALIGRRKNSSYGGDMAF